MRKIVASIILFLSLTAITTGHTTAPIQRVPQELFSPVAVNEYVPIHTALPSFTPTPEPSPTPIPKPKPTRQPDKTYAIVEGWATTYGNGYNGLTALPEGRGIRVRITGPAGSIIRTSNDAGPSLAMQRKGRIIDLDKDDFDLICGCSWYIKGKVWVTVEYLK